MMDEDQDGDEEMADIRGINSEAASVKGGPGRDSERTRGSGVR